MTKRQQKAQQRQARHDRQVARRIEKKRAMTAQVEVPDEDADLEEGDELEEVDSIEAQADETEDPTTEDEPEEVEDVIPVRKDYGADAMPMMGGPTSWDELDAQRAAEEQAHEVREASWDVSDLVHNIMMSPGMDAPAKASAIQDVGSGFGERVSKIMASSAQPDDGESDGGDGEDMQMSKSVDMDLLYTEAVLAADRRHITWQEGMSEWFTRAKLSYGAKKAKGDSSFALVYTTKGASGKSIKVRKYLIHDKAHVRNALARAAQQIKRGGEGARDARRALPKIHAAAKRMGIGMGKANDANAVILEKDAKGDWRWVGWASNNFIDWHGDIISKEAHQEYVGFLDKNPELAPIFMTWHTPGTERKQPVDFWQFEKGFLILSGKLTEPEAAALLKAQSVTDLGLSISGFGLRENKDDPRVITKYRMVEVSDLPLENAANPFTDFSVIVKEVDMDKTEYLAAILGSEEKAKAFMEKTGMKQEQLEKAGVTQKEVEAPKAPAAPGDAQAIIAEVFKEMDIEGLNAFVMQAKDDHEKVEALEALVKDLQTNQDQKLAEKITPPATRFAWASKARASESDDTVVQKDDELVKRTPGLGNNWLSEATHTQPIAIVE